MDVIRPEDLNYHTGLVALGVCVTLCLIFIIVALILVLAKPKLTTGKPKTTPPVYTLPASYHTFGTSAHPTHYPY